MAKKVVGLKLGASRLNAACVAVNGSAEVVQLAGAPLPAGLIAGGEVREVEALAEALKQFFGKHKLPKRNVRIGIANNRVGVRTIDVSGIEDPKQLANAVRFRAQEALPIPIDEAVLDFQILGQGTAADGSPSTRVLLVVAYRDLIASYMEACRLAGIRSAGRRPGGVRAPPRPDALLRREAGRGRRSQRARGRLDRLRAQRPRRLGRLQLRVHARARLGR